MNANLLKVYGIYQSEVTLSYVTSSMYRPSSAFSPVIVLDAVGALEGDGLGPARLVERRPGVQFNRHFKGGLRGRSQMT